MQENFDVIILAGYDHAVRDPQAQADPASNAGEQPHSLMAGRTESHKALIEVGGRPMLARVLDAVNASPALAKTIVIGFDASPLGNDDTAHYLPNQGSIYANLMAAFTFLAEQQTAQQQDAPPNNERHVLLLTADIPLLESHHIAWFLEACKPFDKDVYMGIVEQKTMERTFPAGKRTYVSLREGKFCNGELCMARIDAALRRQAIFEDIIARRKSALRQVQLLGPGLLLKFLFRRLSLEDVLAFVRRRIHLEAAAVLLPFAETGMDIDKPEHLMLVETYLAQTAKNVQP